MEKKSPTHREFCHFLHAGKQAGSILSLQPVGVGKKHPYTGAEWGLRDSNSRSPAYESGGPVQGRPLSTPERVFFVW